MLRKHMIRAALIGALLVPAFASAAVPTTMTQQGRLLNSDGTPVTGSKSIRFALYDAANGGATLWEDSIDVTFDETGFYTAVLGGGSNPLDAMVFGDGVAYLTMAVDGGEEMSPRQAVTSVPYAQIAGGVAPGSITEDALDPSFMLGADNITDVNWAALQNVPAGLSDGDDDTLGGVTCNQGQVVGYGTSGWACVDVLTNQTTTLSSLSCGMNQVAGYNGSNWVCLDWVAPSSTLGALACTNGQIPVRNGSDWGCGDFPTTGWASITGVPADFADGNDADTLGGLSCANGQLAIRTNGAWACGNFPTIDWSDIANIPVDIANGDHDTFATFTCPSGQFLKSTGTGWSCQTDNNTTYSAGTGLALNGTTFSFNTAYTVPNATQAANAGTLDNLDSTAFFRLASANTASNTNTFNGTTNLVGATNIGASATTTAKRVYRDKAGAIGPVGTTTTYTTSLNRLHIRNDRRQETLEIPQTDLEALCGDEDGCTISVSMKAWSTGALEQVHANNRGLVHMQYNVSNGVWRLSDNAPVTGQDGNNVGQNIDMGWSCCYISDMAYISGVAQADNTRSMYLLNWASGTCPVQNNLECHMTIDD